MELSAEFSTSRLDAGELFGGIEEKRPEHWRWMESRYADSPMHQAFGLRLRVVGAGRVEVDYSGEKIAQNRRGVVSGGALSTMIDTAGMQAVRTALEKDDDAVTIELKVNFLRPASADSLLTVGKLVHMGGRTAVSLVEVFNAGGEVVAIGLVTASIRRVK